jgi:hypothetical protein
MPDISDLCSADTFIAMNNHTVRPVESQLSIGPALALSSSWTETYPHKDHDEIVIYIVYVSCRIRAINLQYVKWTYIKNCTPFTALSVRKLQLRCFRRRMGRASRQRESCAVVAERRTWIQFVLASLTNRAASMSAADCSHSLQTSAGSTLFELCIY